MKIILPMTVNDAALLSSNVAETDHAAYSAGTSYSLGNRVIVVAADVHKIFESLQNTNMGHDPLLDDQDTPVYWLEIGPTNRWKMFDQLNSSRTTNSDSIAVSIRGDGRVNALAAVGIEAAEIRVVITDPVEGVVYDQTESLVDSGGVSDWYEYFFAPFDRKTDFFKVDLPPYSDAQIDVTLTDAGHTVECANLVLGQWQSLGDTRWEAEVGIQDYSVKSTDEFGNTILTERAFSRVNSIPVWLDATLTDRVVRTLERYRATPLVWIGIDHIGSTIVFGFFRDFRMVLAGPVHSLFDIDIEGLT